VLLARINALLRRSRPSATTSTGDRALRFGGLTIDLVARTVMLNGRNIPLSSMEFELLAYLAARAGEVQSREVIFRVLMRREYDGMDRVLDIRVSHLRRKMGDALSERIKTIWGQGYLFVPTAW
jgi:two-component system OmpR family response regulator/two-component system response regulator RstA